MAAPLVIGAGLALLPVPPGLAANAWRYFAVFCAVIVGIIAEPFPPAAISLSVAITAPWLAFLQF